MLCFIAALRRTTVAHVAIIYAAAPLTAAGLAWIAMAERPRFASIVASLVALGGGVFMVGLGAEGSAFGDLLALGMTVAVAAIIVLSRRYPSIPTTQAACLSAVLSAAAALPFAQDLVVTVPQLGWLAAFGISHSALGLTLFLLGSRYLPSVQTALISALDAPLAPIWVWLLFSKTPSGQTLIGGGVVLSAILGYIVYDARANSAEG
jgi:drug/metabolite transporter (DMT)-like permease